MTPCLTLSNIRYVLRVKWTNPGKGLAPSSTPRCYSYWKGSLLVALDYSRQLYFTPSLCLGVVAIEKGAFWSPSTTVANFTLLYTFPMPRCSSYWKGRLLVALDYGRQLCLIERNIVINIWLISIITKLCLNKVHLRSNKYMLACLVHKFIYF